MRRRSLASSPLPEGEGALPSPLGRRRPEGPEEGGAGERGARRDAPFSPHRHSARRVVCARDRSRLRRVARLDALHSEPRPARSWPPRARARRSSSIATAGCSGPLPCRMGAGGCRRPRMTSIRAMSRCWSPMRTGGSMSTTASTFARFIRAGAQWLTARPCGVGRLDLADAGRAADRAATRAHDRRQAAPDRARARDRARGRQGRARSTVTSRLPPSAAISRACGRPRSPISARSRCKLTLAEAALLVALPQSPEARRPDRSPAAARAARDRVLDSRRRARRHQRSRRRGGEARAGPASAPRLSRARRARRRGSGRRRQPAPKSSSFPSTRGCRRSSRRWPRRASRGSGRNCRRRSSSSTMRRGEIRARVGSAGYDDSSRDGAIDMSRSPRSPGSALKPFIYALAFEQGLAHPETRLFDRPMRYGAYAPENFNLGYEGAVTARKALQMSLNLPAVELLADVGPATFLARLHSAGRRDRAAEGYADRPRHRPWRPWDFAHRSRAALRRLGARRRGAAADRAARRLSRRSSANAA